MGKFPLAHSYGVEIIRKEKDGDCPHGPTNDQNQLIHAFTTFLSPPGDIGRLRLPGVSNLAPSASIFRFPRGLTSGECPLCLAIFGYRVLQAKVPFRAGLACQWCGAC